VKRRVGFVALLNAEYGRVGARRLHGRVVDRRRKVRRGHCRYDSSRGRSGDDRADSDDVGINLDVEFATDGMDERVQRFPLASGTTATAVAAKFAMPGLASSYPAAGARNHNPIAAVATVSSGYKT